MQANCQRKCAESADCSAYTFRDTGVEGDSGTCAVHFGLGGNFSSVLHSQCKIVPNNGSSLDALTYVKEYGMLTLSVSSEHGGLRQCFKPLD